MLLSNGEQGIVYASTKTMKKKPDNVYCNYQTDEYENLGSYLEFLDPAPSDPDAVLDLCLAHFDERH